MVSRRPRRWSERTSGRCEQHPSRRQSSVTPPVPQVPHTTDGAAVGPAQSSLRIGAREAGCHLFPAHSPTSLRARGRRGWAPCPDHPCSGRQDACLPAIGEEARAGDVTACGTGEEGDDLGGLVWARPPGPARRPGPAARPGRRAQQRTRPVRGPGPSAGPSRPRGRPVRGAVPPSGQPLPRGFSRQRPSWAAPLFPAAADAGKTPGSPFAQGFSRTRSGGGNPAPAPSCAPLPAAPGSALVRQELVHVCPLRVNAYGALFLFCQEARKPKVSVPFAETDRL